MTPDLADPLAVTALLWPHVRLYDKQVEVIRSVESTPETYVAAGNQLGKDFVAGLVCVNLFLRALKAGRTCRIVTTSVAEHHLKVLWGEVGRFITTARYPLVDKQGGPLTVNYQEVRRASERESKNPVNYLVGRVSAKGEGLAGHHAEVSLFVADEASGLDDEGYRMAQGWAKRMLIFGNCNPCSNYFRRGVDGGDLRVT